jgi:hypothetical protein
MYFKLVPFMPIQESGVAFEFGHKLHLCNLCVSKSLSLSFITVPHQQVQNLIIPRSHFQNVEHKGLCRTLLK